MNKKTRAVLKVDEDDYSKNVAFIEQLLNRNATEPVKTTEKSGFKLIVEGYTPEEMVSAVYLFDLPAICISKTRRAA